MKRIYLFLGWGLVGLGVLHCLAAFRLAALTTSALWFFSGGVTIVLTGALNVLNRRYGAAAPGLRWVCIGANVVATAFGIVYGIVGRASLGELVLVIGLVGGALVLSLTRSVLI
jgi:hypothetical protein